MLSSFAAVMRWRRIGHFSQMQRPCLWCTGAECGAACDTFAVTA